MCSTLISVIDLTQVECSDLLEMCDLIHEEQAGKVVVAEAAQSSSQNLDFQNDRSVFVNVMKAVETTQEYKDAWHDEQSFGLSVKRLFGITNAQRKMRSISEEHKNSKHSVAGAVCNHNSCCVVGLLSFQETLSFLKDSSSPGSISWHSLE